jgi:hypothetical protein
MMAANVINSRALVKKAICSFGLFGSAAFAMAAVRVR